MSKWLWLTWEVQRRNQSITNRLDIPLFEITSPHPRLLRYMSCGIRTLYVLFTRRPRLIFAQCPSTVLALLCIVFGKVFRTPVVIDAHNATFDALSSGAKWHSWLVQWILSEASLTIVTNEALATVIADHNGQAAILPDPLPNLPAPAIVPSVAHHPFVVLFICTWAGDEPYLEVIDSASTLDPDTWIYITGKSPFIDTPPSEGLPSNVVLTGYVSEQRFIDLLYSADVILDLTTRSDCLVCGAYEATSMEKPMILSKTSALQRYFDQGALFTTNSANDIAATIKLARERIEELSKGVAHLKKIMPHRWDLHKEDLLEKLNALDPA